MQSEKKAAIAAALLATFFTCPLSALADERSTITELLSTVKSKTPHLLTDKKEGRHDRHHRYHRTDVCRQDFDADSLDVSSLSFENEFLPVHVKENSKKKEILVMSQTVFKAFENELFNLIKEIYNPSISFVNNDKK